MTIDIDKLEALALAADEGPWDTDTGGEVHKAGRTIYAWPRLSGPVRTGANMEYGAAADPTTILALIARLREAEAREQALAAHVERFNSLMDELAGELDGGDEFDSDHIPADLWTLRRSAPTTSLARLIAEKQAAEVREVAADVRADYGHHTQYSVSLLACAIEGYADALSRKAGEGE